MKKSRTYFLEEKMIEKIERIAKKRRMKFSAVVEMAIDDLKED